LFGHKNLWEGEDAMGSAENGGTLSIIPHYRLNVIGEVDEFNHKDIDIWMSSFHPFG
jgi:hypothetical protein